MAPYKDDRASRASDVALLRRLRAGADVPYVHRVDVCSAAPADLAANLLPAPGTGDQTAEDAYGNVWYFYCPKKYATEGKSSGYRQRAVAGGDTHWKPERSPQVIHGPEDEGGTFCKLTYGRGPSSSFQRLGWNMTEYDVVNEHAAAATGDHVLCKLYRSPHAKGTPAPSTSTQSEFSTPSNKTAKMAPTSSCSKRKADSGGAEARRTKRKSIYQQQVQQYDVFSNEDPTPCDVPQQVNVTRSTEGDSEEHALQELHAAPDQDREFVETDTEYGPMPFQLAHINVDELIGLQETFGEEDGQGLQQPRAEQGQAGENIQITTCGLVVPAVAEATVADMLGPETTISGECIGMSAVSTIPDADFFISMVRECHARSRTSSSDLAAPMVAEVTLEGLLSPEMMSGEGINVPTASIPPDDDFFSDVDLESVFGGQEEARARASTSHAPSSSAVCSRLVQGPPMWFPYSMYS